MTVTDTPRDTAPDVWSAGECEGTPHCPPRCPHFVDRSGTRLLVRTYDDEFDALTEMYDSFDRSVQTLGIPPRDPSDREEWLRTLVDDGLNLLAFDGDRVVGHVATVPATDPDPELVIFVRSAYQGRGIGTELLRQTIAHTAAGGHEALTLRVARTNRDAIRVYRRVGFDVVRTESGALVMRLGLDDPIAERVRLPPTERDDGPTVDGNG